jgi:hypothetical protein
MRKDMPKVIVERPRRGNPKRARPGRAVPLEDADGGPLRARKPPVRKQKTKRLNENLAPLKRYLAAQIGRPWSKVYSEIAENLKPSNTVQQHVRDHVEDFVAITCRMRAGQVFTASRRLGGEAPLSQDWRKLYVHPRTGLLRRNEKAVTWKESRRLREAAIAAERAARMREIAPLVQLHRLDDGVWWEVRLARRGGDERDVDVVLRAKLTTREPADLYGRRGVYAADKRILSKAEKKAQGLK